MTCVILPVLTPDVALCGGVPLAGLAPPRKDAGVLKMLPLPRGLDGGLDGGGGRFDVVLRKAARRAEKTGGNSRGARACWPV
jgi:hypothetical protein